MNASDSAIQHFAAKGAKPKPKPLEAHVCACGAEACFGLCAPFIPEQWFCRAHKPADFYTRRAA